MVCVNFHRSFFCLHRNSFSHRRSFFLNFFSLHFLQMICAVCRFQSFCHHRNFFFQNFLRMICVVCLRMIFFLNLLRTICVVCRHRSFCRHRNFFSQSSLRKVFSRYALRSFFFHCVLRKSALRRLKNVRFLVSCCGRCRLFCCLPFL